MNIQYIVCIISLLLSYTAHGSEENITIVPLQQHEIPAAIELVRKDLPSLCYLPINQSEREEKAQRVLVKAELCFNNNEPMSSVPRIERSFTRLVLKKGEKIKGLVEYCLQDNNNGYIEALCSSKKNRDYNKMLLFHAIKQLQEKNVITISTHLLSDDNYNIQLHQELGFIELEQNEEEKAFNFKQFQYKITR